MDQIRYRAWSCKRLGLQLCYFLGLPNVYLSKSFDQPVRLEEASNRFKMRHRIWEAWTALPILAVNNQDESCLETTADAVCENKHSSPAEIHKSNKMTVKVGLRFFQSSHPALSPVYLCGPTLPAQLPQTSLPPQRASVQNHTRGRDHPCKCRERTVTC